MPARWKTGLALLALSIAGQLGAEPLAPQALVVRCASQADAKLAGISALDHACPGVAQALDQLGLVAFLPAGWQKTVTARGLADVAALAQRYAGSPASEPPRAADLRSIAARLVLPPRPLTWWDRIRARMQRWTDSLLERVGRWLRSLALALRQPRHPQAIFYGLVALLLAVIATLLILALRGAGRIRSQRRRAPAPQRRDIAASFTGPDEAPSRELDWAQLREQPARVLRLLVDMLTRAHRLEHDPHLTCRELETEARFETESERAGFARVARLAERELYGPPAANVLSEEDLRDAKLLHERLLAAGGGLRP